MGKFLEEKGAIESREDVFYFHLEELIAMDQPGGNYRDLIMDRRVIHYDQGEINVHGRLRHDHEGNWVPDASPQREVLHASQSLDLPMEGEVLLISQEDRMPESPEVLKGKILVMHAASPGIVHQLPWIAGLICESGSTLSHSSVLCREFGIPAIFGVKGAFERLQSGQKIRFLPRSGIIEPIG
jgi:pyruvate,water dikinase